MQNLRQPADFIQIEFSPILELQSKFKHLTFHQTILLLYMNVVLFILFCLLFYLPCICLKRFGFCLTGLILLRNYQFKFYPFLLVQSDESLRAFIFLGDFLLLLRLNNLKKGVYEVSDCFGEVLLVLYFVEIEYMPSIR